tara:strand:- start:1516 stop:1791 length:276 start_codon:yes stop_codon:yes gene_type:complete
MNKKEITQIIREEIQKIVAGKVGNYEVFYQYREPSGEEFRSDGKYSITQDNIDKSFDKEDTSIQNLLKSIIEKDYGNTVQVTKIRSSKKIR